MGMIFALLMTGAAGCPRDAGSADAGERVARKEATVNDADLRQATLGGGCFWCLEAVFERLKGVAKVDSGYAGGTVANPTYEEVCTGSTGHAEVVQIHYDPEIIAYDDLLDVFFAIHDPTTLNRQGADVGTQYRSVIFFHDDEQKAAAEKAIAQRAAQKAFRDPIVTQVQPLGAFYMAEPYHQEYYERNRGASYCRIVIDPKLKKLEKDFAAKVE